MTWLLWLGLAAIITAIAAVTGMKAKGTRHVAHTRLMSMGRLMLVIIALILAYLAYHVRAGA